MKDLSFVKYLGDIISIQGNNKENIENRRYKGCGKLAEIASFVLEMPWQHRIEFFLLYRIWCN